VLISEASHGTHNSYREGALITRQLIEEKGFNAVAIEGDWPDASRVHRFVRGVGEDDNARDALGDFLRFRAWMWRNLDGVPSENGPDRTLRLTQRPEFAFTEFRGVAPLVVAGEIDVLPAKRGKMLSERRVWGMPVFA
jgi:hypothetical protein